MNFRAMLMMSLVLSSPLVANGQARRVAHSYARASTHYAAAKGNAGLVIVPFAVPVAVPVATVQQPSVLYSYRQYADVEPQAATIAAARRDAAAVPQQSTTAAAVLTRHCASCHRSLAAQGNLTLFDTGGALVSRLPRQAILDAVEQGRMPQPPTAARLSAEELELLRAWAKPPKDLLY